MILFWQINVPIMPWRLSRLRASSLSQTRLIQWLSGSVESCCTYYWYFKLMTVLNFVFTSFLHLTIIQLASCWIPPEQGIRRCFWSSLISSRISLPLLPMRCLKHLSLLLLWFDQGGRTNADFRSWFSCVVTNNPSISRRGLIRNTLISPKLSALAVDARRLLWTPRICILRGWLKWEKTCDSCGSLTFHDAAKREDIKGWCLFFVRSTSFGELALLWPVEFRPCSGV